MGPRSDTAESSKTLQVKAWLREGIVSGRIRPGSKLPSERRLCSELGVSRPTVSKVVGELIVERYLHRRRGGGAVYVSEDAARAGRANAVAVVFAARVAQAENNPFFHGAFVGVEERAAELGLSVIVSRMAGSGDRNGWPSGLTAEKVDGLIGCGFRWDGELAGMVRSLGRPVVSIQDDGTPWGITSIVADDERSATDAVDHLTGLGHRRIAFLHSPVEPTNSRWRGYWAGLAKAKIEFREELSVSVESRDPEMGYRAAGEVLGRRPTAVLCENDSLAAGLISAFRERGVRVPQDVSIAGFDDSGIAQTILPPIGLTTVRLPIRTMGRLALEHLMALVESAERGEVSRPAVKILVPTQLVIRDTTAAPGGP